MNLGSIALMGILYVAKMIFVFVILFPLKSWFSKSVPSFERYYIRYKTQLFFSDFLTIIFEAYLELLLTLMLYWDVSKTNLDYNTGNSVMSYFILAFLTVLVPSFIVYVLI